MSNQVDLLCRELSRRGLAFISPKEMDAVLEASGLRLTGGERATAEDHLTLHQELSGAISEL
jgi:hypothetical protein